MKKIVIASDHGGVALKEDLKIRLTEVGISYVNLGADSPDAPVDYPDVAQPAANLVNSGEVDFGILICGTGLGICMAANKIKGIRAVTCSDTFSARMAREHNNANILTVGARVLGNELVWDIVHTFLHAQFKGGRHQTRLDKITALEEHFLDK